MVTVKFQCIRSGNFVSFTNENDIAGLRKHEGYKEVLNVEAPKTLEIESEKATIEKVLKRGRPAKVPSFLE